MDEIIVEFMGNNYQLVDKIDKYVFFSNLNDYNDFFVRIDNGSDEYLPLSGEAEVNKALMLFLKAHKDEINKEF